ncbi:MAG: N-acetyltransferase [Proteobacteria bacterium]|nr:N-acetyltransferase [Pseudomonadota bacterium]
MQPADLPAVFALQCRAHPADYHEPVDALASRLEVGSEYCFVAERDALAGYVFAHPWAGKPPVLHAPIKPCASPHHVFLHDLAVCPTCRGVSASRRLFDAVRLHAIQHGFDTMQLVAVGSAQTFWQGLGFDVVPDQRLHASYGDAVLMQRTRVAQDASRAAQSNPCNV